MAMHGKGLTKLIEECGELTQVAAKKLAYPDTEIHPDGGELLTTRLENEIADVMAALRFVGVKFKLNLTKIDKRATVKFNQYVKWDDEK